MSCGCRFCLAALGIFLDDDEVVQNFSHRQRLWFVILFVVVDEKNRLFDANGTFLTFNDLNVHFQGKGAVWVFAVEIAPREQRAVNAINKEMAINIRDFKGYEQSIHS